MGEIQELNLNRFQLNLKDDTLYSLGKKKHFSEEICLIADSCFSGGQRFLAAPKIFPLERNDCALACAGDTFYSFPVVEHIRNAISLNQGLRDRAIDFTDLLHSITDITNKVLFQEMEKQPKGIIGPGFSMIIAGYSWKLKKPILRELKYNSRKKLMYINQQRTIMKTPFVVIGDDVSKARYKIFCKLKEDGIQNGDDIDMQPFDVLMEYINDPNIRSIDGNPQMVKIYPFMNVLPFGFYHKDKSISFFGRPLTNYETFPYPIINIETGEQFYMKGIRNDFELKPETPKPLIKLHHE